MKKCLEKTLEVGHKFHRLRIAHNVQPIRQSTTAGLKELLDSPGFPIIYGSQDIDVWIQEVLRFTVATTFPRGAALGR